MIRRSNKLTVALPFTALVAAGLLAATSTAAVAQTPPPQAAAPAEAAATQAPAAGSLTVTFSGIKTPTGAVMLALYDSQAAYDSGKATRREMIQATGDTVTITLTGLTPGSFAIKAFHDVNGDGKMGANPFGIPTEPYAFSNDAKGSMGPAKWDAAAFEVKAGDNTQTIHID